MQQIINQILDGNFEYDSGSLDFSCARLELTMMPGSIQEGTFSITATSGRPACGTITTSDLRMECLTPEFNGITDTISYRFHAEDLEEGDVVKGEFYAVSNRGEYSLPFIVTIEHILLDSSIGNIKNLFHFANLAKTNWEEAVSLFYTPHFKRIFQGSDQRYYDCYRGLSANMGSEQGVEEFLMEIHKKQKVEYFLEESMLVLEKPAGISESMITITRSGWGYTFLRVEVEGNFLLIEKEQLTDNDFLGNVCRLPVYVDSSLLHRGRNFGKVLLVGSYQTLEIPVVVHIGENKVSERKLYQEKKHLLVQLMEYYKAFRLKKISSATWLQETEGLVSRMVAINGKDPAARLFQAQIMITQENYSEAQRLLERIGELLEQRGQEAPVLYAYYLYLTTLIHGDEEYVNQVTARVEQIYRRNRSSWQVAWLLLYLSEDFNRKPAQRWDFLEKQFIIGSTSPILYTEALLLLNNNPALLRKLGDYELQILYYGIREEMISVELVEQVLYLAGKRKEYSPVLYRILTVCYEKRKDVRILREICTLLIKGGRTGRKYYEWYRLGVENELRITNLYEYFMMSVDLDTEQQLPKRVLMYFGYQSNLDYERAAFLYCYVHRHRGEFPGLYETYQERIEYFIQEQLKKEHINRSLAYLYQEVLKPEQIGEHNASALSRLMYTHLIQVKRPSLRNVIVYQLDNREEKVYALTEGRALVTLYGSEYTLLFEDGEGNRFAENAEYTVERLMYPGRFLRYVAPLVTDNLELDLYLSESTRENKAESNEYAQRGMRLLRSPQVSLNRKRELRLNVLRQFYDKDDMRSLDAYLEQIPVEELTPAGRREVLYFLVLRGRYDIAYDWLNRYGPYFADAKTLMRLLSEAVMQTEYIESAVLTASALRAFQKGKYDGNILRYLTLHFKGMTKQMRDIWRAACSFDVDCYELCEKMLVQMLYTGSFVGEKLEIFRYYVSQGAKAEVVEAFLAQCAYDYFVKDKHTESYVFEEMIHAYQRKEPVQKVCRLACLKYYAGNKKERREENREVLRQFLSQMLKEGILLECFRSYREFGTLLLPMADKTIVEYHAHPEARVKIHYVVLGENGEAGEYLTEAMKPVYGGVVFREFVLFFGENVQYYISEERDGKEQMTESGSLRQSDSRGETDNGRFELLNDIVISKKLQDYDTLDGLVEEYYHKQYVNSKLFSLR